MTENLAHLRYVTANFHYLQGLRSVPWGVFFLLAAGGAAGWYAGFLPGRYGYLEGAVLLATLGAAWAVSRYYAETFGRVDAPRAKLWRDVLSVAGLLAAAVLDGVAEPPVSLLGLTFAGLFAVMFVEWHERVHYLVVALVLAGLSVLPALPGIAADDAMWGRSGAAFFFALGAGMIIGGLLDHRLLARTLPPPPEAHDETEEVAHG